MSELRDAVQALQLADMKATIASKYAGEILSVAIAEFTVQHRLTQSELAERAGISKECLQLVITSRSYCPNVAAYLLAHADDDRQSDA